METLAQITIRRRYHRAMTEQLRAPRLTAGVAMIFMALALAGARVVELATRGAIDADDPAASLAYLADSGDSYVVTGILLVVFAISLVVAAVATREVLRESRRSLWIDAGAVAGYLAAGALGIAGVMRVAAPGPLAYIASMDRDWGESAYLVVQVAGTQSLFAGGVLGMSLWLVGFAIAAWRRRSVARGALVTAVFGADFVFALFAPLVEVPDGVFALHLFSLMVGLPLACATIGGALLVRGVRMRRRLAHAP
jgi:hypothetical protein